MAGWKHLATQETKMKNTVINRLFITATVIFFSFTFINAQTDADEDIIKVNTKSVQTTLRAGNSKGKPQSIEQSDLQLMVDGKPQEIAYFAPNRVNKFIVLLDASDSMKGKRYERCVWFLNELAESALPEQSFDVIVFAERTEFIGTFTKKDKKAIFNKLKKLVPDGETALYESVVETLQKLDRQAETSALIVLTDGGDNMSSSVTKNKAEKLLGEFGTLTYLIVLDTKMAFRDPTTAPSDNIAKEAVKDFERILQPVSYIIKNEIQFNKLAASLPREAGYLVKIGFDPEENLLSDQQTHKLEIVHSDKRLELNYRQTFLMNKGEDQ